MTFKREKMGEKKLCPLVKMDLVVARTVCDSMDWLLQVAARGNAPRIFVYDTSGEAAPTGLPPNVLWESRPNEGEGREAETYVHHIVKNFYQLSHVTFFVQGNPFDHMTCHPAVFLDAVCTPRAWFHGPPEAVPCFGKMAACASDTDGMDLDRVFKQWALGPVPPRAFEYSVGSQWVVPRAVIYALPIEFWKRVEEDVAAVGARQMERLWPHVFRI